MLLFCSLTCHSYRISHVQQAKYTAQSLVCRLFILTNNKKQTIFFLLQISISIFNRFFPELSLLNRISWFDCLCAVLCCWFFYFLCIRDNSNNCSIFIVTVEILLAWQGKAIYFKNLDHRDMIMKQQNQNNVHRVSIDRTILKIHIGFII